MLSCTMGGVSIETSHFIPYPRTIVWDWHSMPGAVVRLTPRNVPMQPVQQADNLASGLTRFSLPAGLVWDAQHELAGYRKGHQFVDVCTSAPIKLFSQWRHVHTFKDEGPSGTMITDSVSTRVPARALKSLFAFRQHALLGDLNASLIRGAYRACGGGDRRTGDGMSLFQEPPHGRAPSRPSIGRPSDRIGRQLVGIAPSQPRVNGSSGRADAAMRTPMRCASLWRARASGRSRHRGPASS